jgi:hypothetical protein
MIAPIKRRAFITLLGGAAASWPLAARAQQVPVIGFLNAGSPAAFSELAAAFRRGLSEAGYVEGQNALIEYRWAEGHIDRLPSLAADLVNRRVAVIASTGGNAVVEAAAAATTTVPIVFLGSDVALKTGLIATLNRPSGNVTGVVMSTSALLSKCLQFLGELVPKDATIGVLVNPNSSTTTEDKEDIQTAARQIGRQIFILTADKEAEIDTAFATLVERHAGGLVVQGDIRRPDLPIPLRKIVAIGDQAASRCELAPHIDRWDRITLRHVAPSAGRANRRFAQPCSLVRLWSSVSADLTRSRRRGDRIGEPMSPFGTLPPNA